MLVEKWNAQRAQAVAHALMKVLYPQMEKEIKSKLLQEAKEYVIEVRLEWRTVSIRNTHFLKLYTLYNTWHTVYMYYHYTFIDFVSEVPSTMLSHTNVKEIHILLWFSTKLYYILLLRSTVDGHFIKV